MSANMNVTMSQGDVMAISQMIQQALAASRDPAYTPSGPTGGGVHGSVGPGNRDAFWYNVFLSNLVSGGATPQNTSIPISADADFYAQGFTFAAGTHGGWTATQEATWPIPPITVLITDTGSNRQLMQNPIPIGTLAGGGERPFRLTRPRLFRRTASINFVFNNTDSAVAYDLYFVLFGFKVYSNVT